MGGEEISFGDEKINKKEFYRNKKLFKVEDIDINKILVSKKKNIWQNRFADILYWI